MPHRIPHARRGASPVPQTSWRLKAAWITLVLLAFGALVAASEARAACKQPVYVIVHRCNDPNDGPMAIQTEGANAIEADFSWGARTIFVDPEWAVDHDAVFPHSTYLDNWLDAVSAELQRPGSELSLIFLDIKDPDGPLAQLYHAMRSRLGPDVNLIFSIPDWTARWNFNQIKDLVNADEHAGVAIDFLDEADAEQVQANVAAFFQDIGIDKYWFGDGLTAALVTPDSVVTNMEDAVALRDSENDCSKFHGAYTWTYETSGSFTQFLSTIGVNGIFVNSPACNGYASPATATDPEVAVALAKSLPSRKWATPADDPFVRFRPAITCPSSVTVECSAGGGAHDSDPSIAAFLLGATSTTDPCSGVTITTTAPAFFPIGATTVTFTATASEDCSPADECDATVTVVDTTAPTIACPAPIAVDPVAPEGTIVTFGATAGDACDGNLVATCPDSGATFPVGTVTTVSCTASDSAGHAVSCSFTVKVYSPQEVVENLQSAVDGLGGLNHGQLTSLQAHLASILASISDGQDAPACQKLKNFIKSVQQLMDSGDLAAAAGQPLIDSAKNLRSTLGCLPFGAPVLPHALASGPGGSAPRTLSRVGGLR